MAGRGPAPKARMTRPTDDKRRQAEQTHVAAGAEPVGPPLPDGIAWPDATRAWWDTWRSSAQATTFVGTDWDFLLDTAVLHAEYWRGELGVAAELRLRVAKLGATPEDRARLRLQVDTPPPGGEQKPPASRKRKPSASARRSRLLSVIDGAADD